MLVLLVSADHVAVVDRPAPPPDETVPQHLLLDGPLVEGEGGRMLPGLDLVYRLVDMAELAPPGAEVVGELEESPAALELADWLGQMTALPVYLQLDPQAARAWREASVTGHPVTTVPGQRPHLQLAPPPIPDVLLRDDERESGPDLPADPIGSAIALGIADRIFPTDVDEDLPVFSMDGVVEALRVGFLKAGQVIRIAGLPDAEMDGPYVVGVVRPIPDGVDCDVLPLTDRPGVDAVEHLRTEAERARAAAEDLRTTNAEGALALAEAAAGYERHADRLAAARS